MTERIKLSKRMRQLLPFLAEGMSNLAIGAAMGISEHTVKVHLWRLYKRIGVHSRAQALKWCQENEPVDLQYALRAAFDAACRLSDAIKANDEDISTAEFEFHREQITKLARSW